VQDGRVVHVTPDELKRECAQNAAKQASAFEDRHWATARCNLKPAELDSFVSWFTVPRFPQSRSTLHGKTEAPDGGRSTRVKMGLVQRLLCDCAG
jgi:hypothetical protein